MREINSTNKWEFKAINKIATITMGQSPMSKYYNDEQIGLPLIQGNADIENRKTIIRTYTSQITKRGKARDIIMSVRAPVGEVARADFDCCLGRGVCSISYKNDYLYHYLIYSEKVWSRFSAGSTFDSVNAKQVNTFEVFLPTLESEQTAIATALSDMDNLIAGLEKLIEKKKAIKQGAMQELLRPKEGWVVKTLRELVRYRRGSFPQPYGLDKWYDDISGAPFVQVFDVDDNFKLKDETKRRISKAAQSMSVYIKKGSLIITLQGSIGRMAITQYDAYVDRTLLIFESFIVPFNTYFFALSVFLLFEKEKENAPGGIIKTITKEALSSFPIAFPNLDEQNRIAEILVAIDNEIEQMENRLIKYKMIKSGMMQELLTGKTRLI